MGRSKLQYRDPQGLTSLERAFVDAYSLCHNAALAYRIAAHNPNAPSSRGSQMMRIARVQTALSAVVENASEAAAFAAQQVIDECVALARADSREIVSIKARSCRYCHGVDHLYQHTPSEQAQRRAVWETRKAANPDKVGPFDEQGGIGYNPVKNPPDPDCPECFGEGVTQVKIADTSTLTPDGVRLYAGAKQTRHGIEVAMHSKLHALDKLGEYYKLFGGNRTPDLDDEDTKAKKIREALRSMDEMTVAAT